MKSLIALGIFVGSIVGGYAPSLFGASSDIFSAWGIVGCTIGAIVGAWAGYKLSQLSDY